MCGHIAEAERPGGGRAGGRAKGRRCRSWASLLPFLSSLPLLAASTLLSEHAHLDHAARLARTRPLGAGQARAQPQAGHPSVARARRQQDVDDARRGPRTVPEPLWRPRVVHADQLARQVRLLLRLRFSSVRDSELTSSLHVQLVGATAVGTSPRSPVRSSSSTTTRSTTPASTCACRTGGPSPSTSRRLSRPSPSTTGPSLSLLTASRAGRTRATSVTCSPS